MTAPALTAPAMTAPVRTGRPRSSGPVTSGPVPADPYQRPGPRSQPEVAAPEDRARLVNGQNHLAESRVAGDQLMSPARLGDGDHRVDDRTDIAGFDQWPDAFVKR